MVKQLGYSKGGKMRTVDFITQLVWNSKAHEHRKRADVRFAYLLDAKKPSVFVAGNNKYMYESYYDGKLAVPTAQTAGMKI